MSIEYIDEIADAMVDVCVMEFGANPVDDGDGLLWEYFRSRLIEAAREVQDASRKAHHDAERKVKESFNTGSIRDTVKAKGYRRQKAVALMSAKESSKP